jgi:hypothetical protein
MEQQVACMRENVNIYRNLYLKEERNNNFGDTDGDEKKVLWRICPM